MLSKTPVDLRKIKPADSDREILRVSIIAELDATSLYEQLASMTKRRDLKKVLQDIAKEEKTHMGEFQALLLKLDAEQKKELTAGKKEVEELLQNRHTTKH